MSGFPALTNPVNPRDRTGTQRNTNTDLKQW